MCCSLNYFKCATLEIMSGSIIGFLRGILGVKTTKTIDDVAAISIRSRQGGLTGLYYYWLAT